MLKAALVGAVALAAVGAGPVSADAHQYRNDREARAGHGVTLTESHIAQARAALRLTPAQARHWPAVAAALRSFARQANRSTAARANGARRVMVAARPLLRSLDAGQRRTAQGMVRAMGFGSYASAF